MASLDPRFCPGREETMNKWFQKIGLVGLAFFTLKGMLWLVAGAVMLALSID